MYDYSYVPERDCILSIVEKFKYHPSIVKIDLRYNFLPVDKSVICDRIESLDKRKLTTYNNTRVLVEYKDIISPFITEMYNELNHGSNSVL